VKREYTIERLKRVVKDPNCARMNMSTVKGYLGELEMFRILENERTDRLSQKGKQAGYDIEYEYKEVGFKIDVKFSTYKVEFKSRKECWGWALKIRNKKRPVTATHFVCVAVNEELDVEAIYVVNAEDIKHFPNGYGQFKGVEHAFVVFPDKRIDASDKEAIRAMKRSQKILTKGYAKKKRKDQRLSEMIYRMK